MLNQRLHFASDINSHFAPCMSEKKVFSGLVQDVAQALKKVPKYEMLILERTLDENSLPAVNDLLKKVKREAEVRCLRCLLHARCGSFLQLESEKNADEQPPKKSKKENAKKSNTTKMPTAQRQQERCS